jgi:hypothetical protein
MTKAILSPNELETLHPIYEKFKIEPKKGIVLMNVATAYHNDCIKDYISTLPSPVNWLKDQKAMRTKWEQYRDGILSSSNPDPVLNNYLLNKLPFAVYMKFMYERFPANFGECLNKIEKE